MTSKKPKDPYTGAWKMRACKHCKLAFSPKARDAATAKRTIFCCRKCKDRYRHFGGLNFELLVELATNAVMKNLLADEKFAEKLAEKLKVVSGSRNALSRTNGEDQLSHSRPGQSAACPTGVASSI